MAVGTDIFAFLRRGGDTCSFGGAVLNGRSDIFAFTRGGGDTCSFGGVVLNGSY